MREVLLSTTDLLVLIFWPAAAFGVSAAVLFWTRNRLMSTPSTRRLAQTLGTVSVILAIVVPVLLGIFVTMTAETATN